MRKCVARLSSERGERRDFKRAAVFLLPLTPARLGNGKLNRAFGNYKGPFDYCPRRQDNKTIRVYACWKDKELKRQAVVES